MNNEQALRVFKRTVSTASLTLPTAYVTVPSVLDERLLRVHERIRQACQRCGRDPSSITLVAVTKTVPPDTIREAVGLGVTDLGENRVQEARAKQFALGSRLKALGQGTSLEPTASSLQPVVRWHLIGHLQRNKAKDAVELFDVIHSVDSLELIEELGRQAAKRNQTIDLFLQVNISGEATKHGCRAEEVESLARSVLSRQHLRLNGLMTIAPFVTNAEEVRPIFRQMRQLRDQLQHALVNGGTQARRHPGTPLRLSMGMSQDFEVAIEEGADSIRVGTAVFGERTS